MVDTGPSLKGRQWNPRQGISLQNFRRENSVPATCFAHSSFELITAFYSEGLNAKGIAAVELRHLQQKLKSTSSLQDAFAQLSGADQSRLSNRVGSENLQRIFYLEAVGDAKLFQEGALNLGRQLKHQEDFSSAMGVFQVLNRNEANPISLRRRAQQESEAMIGTGDGGLRLEFLSGQFVKDAISYKMILPMMAATMAYQVVRTAALGRFANAARATAWNRGWGANLLSGMAGFGAEVNVFTASSLGLRKLAGEPVGSWEREIAGSTVTLGFLKGFGILGREGFQYLHGLKNAGLPVRLGALSRISQPLIPQTSMFLGLLTAHRVETGVGLRAKVDGATTVMDTLSSLVSLGVGARLGQLGMNRVIPGFETYQEGLKYRAQIYGRAVAEPGNQTIGLSGLFHELAPASPRVFSDSAETNSKYSHILAMGMKSRPPGSTEGPEPPGKKNQPTASKKVSRQRIKPREISVRQLKIPISAINYLEKEGIKTLGNLTEVSAEDVLQVKHVGKNALRVIRESLKKYRLSLKNDSKAGTKAYGMTLGLMLFPKIQPKDPTLQKLMNDIPTPDHSSAMHWGLIGVGGAFFVPAFRLAWNIGKAPFWITKKVTQPIWSKFVKAKPGGETSKGPSIISTANQATGWWESKVGVARDFLTGPALGLSLALRDVSSLDGYAPELAAGLLVLYSIGRRALAYRTLERHSDLKGEARELAQQKLLGMFPERPGGKK